jgi:hypothetical protein
MDTLELKPKYKELRFDSEASFKKWLDKTTSKTLRFQDMGQDLQRMHIAESGEILHCDFHANIYNGKFVNTEKLDWFVPVEILNNGKFERMNGLVIDEIA